MHLYAKYLTFSKNEKYKYTQEYIYIYYFFFTVFRIPLQLMVYMFG